MILPDPLKVLPATFMVQEAPGTADRFPEKFALPPAAGLKLGDSTLKLEMLQGWSSGNRASGQQPWDLRVGDRKS
jgi:hypothetical protein